MDLSMFAFGRGHCQFVGISKVGHPRLCSLALYCAGWPGSILLAWIHFLSNRKFVNIKCLSGKQSCHDSICIVWKKPIIALDSEIVTTNEWLYETTNYGPLIREILSNCLCLLSRLSNPRHQTWTYCLLDITQPSSISSQIVSSKLYRT